MKPDVFLRILKVMGEHQAAKVGDGITLEDHPALNPLKINSAGFALEGDARSDKESGPDRSYLLRVSGADKGNAALRMLPGANRDVPQKDQFTQGANDNRPVQQTVEPTGDPRTKGAGMPGTPGGQTSAGKIPNIRMEEQRIQSILHDTPAFFEIDAQNTDSDRFDGQPSYYEIPAFGYRAVKENDPLIKEVAAETGVDADLIRTVMWIENAWGHKGIFNDLADALEVSDTVMPMNINIKLWAKLIDARPEDLANDKKMNIKAAAILLKRISERIKNPTIAKIVSLWHSLMREHIDEMSARAQKIYDNKLWEIPPDIPD